MLDDVMAEAHEWRAKFFPDAPQHHGLLGAIEELGELLRAEDDAAEVDAIADTTIFLMAFCDSRGIAFPNPVPHHYKALATDAVTHLGNLCSAVLKEEQSEAFGREARYKDRDFAAEVHRHLGLLLHTLDTYAGILGTSLEAAVRSTWVKVKARRKS